MSLFDFYRIPDTGHNGEQGDLVPGPGFGIVGQHRGIVVVEDVEDAEGEAVSQRVRATLACGKIELVAKVQAHIDRHLPVVGMGEVVERDFAPRKVADVPAGRHGLPMATLQREGGVEALPPGTGVEDVAAVVAGRERVAVADVGKRAVCLRPGVRQAPFQPG